MEIPKGEMPIQHDFARESALAGYVDALTANSSYAQVKGWMSYASLVRANPVECDTSAGQAIAAQYSAIEKAVDELLMGTGFRTPHYNISIGDVALIADRGDSDEAIVVPVSLTSDGIKAAFSLVADIAYRCVRLNPFYGADACKLTQGVVMIDEVDLFLHPSWQQRILPDLRRIFPKIQFIVTTHSPQVVSSVSQRCLRIVAEDGQITPVSIWTEGVESSRILRDVFGTDPYPAPNEWRQRVNRFVEAVDAGRWNDPDVKKEGEELSAKFTGRDTDFDMARFRIEEEEWERGHASN
jgi:predicted ATP-binding protein involved in virulence